MKRYVILIMLCFIYCTSYAQRKVQTAKQRQMIESISKTTARIKTMQCDFIQITNASYLDSKVTSTGSMFYNVSGSLTWQYKSPYKYIFSINNGVVTTKIGGKTSSFNANGNKMFKNITEMMMNCVSGRNLANNADFVIVMRTVKNEWIADLYPKRMEIKKLFKSIRLHFRNNIVTEVEMKQKNNDGVIITLRNIKTTWRR